MATNTIAKFDVAVEFLPDHTPVISSLDIALHFQKKHKHVLVEIKRIQLFTPLTFTEPNFRPSEYTDPTGRTLPCFLLTRDAFTLLAMGFTGKAAMQWKLRYIEVFNTLERKALTQARQAALQEGMRLQKRMTPQRMATARKALRYRRMGLTLMEIAKLIDSKQTTVHDLLKDANLLALEVSHAR